MNKINTKSKIILLVIGLIAIFYLWQFLTHKHNVFVKGPNMHYPRYEHTATLLKDGRVLIVGGAIFNNNPVFCNYAEIYDLKTNEITLTDKMNVSRISHTATLLKNGNVLIVGGMDQRNRSLPFVEIYNTKENKFHLINPLNVPRANHTATLLSDGTVLIAGGQGTNNYLSSAEIFDIKTNQFKLIKGMNTQRYNHTATLLNNGNVLIVGGASGHGILSSAEIYNPYTEQFKHVGDMSSERWKNTTTLLKNGNVFILGGEDNDNKELATSEIFDVSSNKFKNMAKMEYPRAYHATTLLNNGNILITGGITPLTWGGTTFSYSIIYDTLNNKYLKINHMKKARAQHTATILDNGNVLILGGGDQYQCVTQKQSELFLK